MHPRRPQSTLSDAELLFREFVRAAKKVSCAECPPTMHHSFANQENPWFAREEVSFEFRRAEEAYRIQICLEANGCSSDRRIVIFGRRHEPRNGASENTQRATFNSQNYDPSEGYWIRPHILKKNAAQRHAFEALLPIGDLPDWTGKQFRLGNGSAAELLNRFLLVLRIVEQVKSTPIEELTARFPEPLSIEAGDLRNIRLFREGELQSLTVRQRQRCKQQLDAARDYFRQRTLDGQLHCAVCDWVPPVPVRSEIVQIHHVVPLHTYPVAGKSLSWTEVIGNLQPLCPNCHRLLESHPDGGNYSIAALRKALAPV